MCESEEIQIDRYFASSPPEKSKNKRVLVFGSFDIIHPSHLRFLLEARGAARCSECELVVVLARDSSIERIKKRKPIFGEQQRLNLISGLRVVDYALLGHEGENYFDVILEVKPDYIVLGYDQFTDEKPLLEFVKKHNLKIKIYRLPEFETGEINSSTEIREKVIEMGNNKNENCC